MSISDTDLMLVVCTLLDQAGVGVFRPTGPAYTTGETAIWYGPLDTAPDRGLGVTLYSATDTVGGAPERRRYLQVRVRGAAGQVADADTLAQAVFDTLHGLTHAGQIMVVPPGVMLHGVLAQVRRTSVAHLGADESGRQERADSYEVLLNT